MPGNTKLSRDLQEACAERPQDPPSQPLERDGEAGSSGQINSGAAPMLLATGLHHEMSNGTEKKPMPNMLSQCFIGDIEGNIDALIVKLASGLGVRQPFLEEMTLKDKKLEIINILKEKKDLVEIVFMGDYIDKATSPTGDSEVLQFILELLEKVPECITHINLGNRDVNKVRILLEDAKTALNSELNQLADEINQDSLAQLPTGPGRLEQRMYWNDGGKPSFAEVLIKRLGLDLPKTKQALETAIVDKPDAWLQTEYAYYQLEYTMGAPDALKNIEQQLLAEYKDKPENQELTDDAIKANIGDDIFRAQVVQKYKNDVLKPLLELMRGEKAFFSGDRQGCHIMHGLDLPCQNLNDTLALDTFKGIVNGIVNPLGNNLAITPNELETVLDPEIPDWKDKNQAIQRANVDTGDMVKNRGQDFGDHSTGPRPQVTTDVRGPVFWAHAPVDIGTVFIRKLAGRIVISTDYSRGELGGNLVSCIQHDQLSNTVTVGFVNKQTLQPDPSKPSIVVELNDPLLGVSFDVVDYKDNTNDMHDMKRLLDYLAIDNPVIADKIKGKTFVGKKKGAEGNTMYIWQERKKEQAFCPLSDITLSEEEMQQVRVCQVRVFGCDYITELQPDLDRAKCDLSRITQYGNSEHHDQQIIFLQQKLRVSRYESLLRESQLNLTPDNQAKQTAEPPLSAKAQGKQPIKTKKAENTSEAGYQGYHLMSAFMRCLPGRKSVGESSGVNQDDQHVGSRLEEENSSLKQQNSRLIQQTSMLEKRIEQIIAKVNKAYDLLCKWRALSFFPGKDKTQEKLELVFQAVLDDKKTIASMEVDMKDSGTISPLTGRASASLRAVPVVTETIKSPADDNSRPRSPGSPSSSPHSPQQGGSTSTAGGGLALVSDPVSRPSSSKKVQWGQTARALARSKDPYPVWPPPKEEGGPNSSP